MRDRLLVFEDATVRQFHAQARGVAARIGVGEIGREAHRDTRHEGAQHRVRKSLRREGVEAHSAIVKERCDAELGRKRASALVAAVGRSHISAVAR